MSLLQTTVAYLGKFYPLLTSIAIETFAGSLFQVWCLQDLANRLWYLIMFKLVWNPAVGWIEQHLMSSMVTKISKDFIAVQYMRYETASYISKNHKTALTYHGNLQGAANSLAQSTSWGFNVTMNVMEGLVACLYMFIGDIRLIVLCVASFTVIAYLTNRGMWEFKQSQKHVKKQFKRNLVKVTHDLPLWQNGVIKTSRMLFKENNIQDTSYTIELSWINIISQKMMLSKLIYLFIILSPDVVTGYIVFDRLAASVASFNEFLMRYKKLDMDFDLLMDMFNEMQFERDALVEKLPKEGIIILPSRVDVLDKNNSNQLITLVQIPYAISIPQGFRVWINGPSGEGKTSLIKAIVGKLHGLTFRHGSPQSLRGHWGEYDVTLKENTPTNDITIRDMFEDALESDIFQYARICAIDDYIIKNGLDTEIHAEISSGQKTRLILASVLYRTRDCRNLVFDEVDQGLDFENIHRVVQNIWHAFPEKTLIFVSHFNFGKYHWDMKLRVLNSLITEVNQFAVEQS